MKDAPLNLLGNPYAPKPVPQALPSFILRGKFFEIAVFMRFFML
jgi:hypothetical protein